MRVRMKPGALTFPMPPLTADPVGAALPAALPSLIRQLTGLADWPEDHGIRVRLRGQYTPLVYARVATSRHVVEILFDPSTGHYECTNCQTIDFMLPTSIPDEAQGSFVVAVIRGLSAAAATALHERRHRAARAVLAPLGRAGRCRRHRARRRGFRGPARRRAPQARRLNAD